MSEASYASLIGNNSLDNYYSSGNQEVRTSIEKAKNEVEAKIAQMQLSSQEEDGKTKEIIHAFFSQHSSLISKHLTSKENKGASLDNYLKLKEAISNQLQSKTQSLALLTKAKKFLSSSSPTPEEVSSLMKSLKSDKAVSSNKQLLSSLTSDLMKLSKRLLQSQLNPEESEKEDDSSLILLRNIIKSSYEESISTCTLELSPDELLKELNYISALQTPNAKANELKDKFIISPSFRLFILQLFNDSLPFDTFKKSLELLHLLYSSYSKRTETSFDNFSPLIQLHNNIEMLLIVISYKILFPPLSIDATLYANAFISFKNFSSDLISEVISSFISQLTTEMYQIETFENISYDANFSSCDLMLNRTQALTLKFFSSLKQYAIQREFVFNLNYVLSLLFDVLNRKILLVKDFSVNDIKSLLSLGKKIAPKLKSNLELIAGDDSALAARLSGVFDTNAKYKKFEEILFVLNANLKEIRNFLIEADFKIHIDPNELIELITSIFELNENSSKLLQFIKEKLLSESE